MEFAIDWLGSFLHMGTEQSSEEDTKNNTILLLVPPISMARPVLLKTLRVLSK